MGDLRKSLIHLARETPELRVHLVPLIREAGLAKQGLFTSLVVMKGIQNLTDDYAEARKRQNERFDREDREERARLLKEEQTHKERMQKDPEYRKKVEEDRLRGRSSQEWDQVEESSAKTYADERDQVKSQHQKQRDGLKSKRKDLDAVKEEAAKARLHWKEHRKLPDGSKFKSYGEVKRTLKDYEEGAKALDTALGEVDTSEKKLLGVIDHNEESTKKEVRSVREKFEKKPEKAPEKKDPEKKPTLMDRARALFRKYKEKHPATEKTPSDFVKKASEEALRESLLRLAHEKPELRVHLVPLTRTGMREE